MKLMIASDLHGSAYYTQALLRRMEEKARKARPARRHPLPRPAQCPPARLRHESVRRHAQRARKAPLCIRGNCDGEVDQMVLNFPVLADFAAVFADGYTLYLTHGHHLDEASKAAAPATSCSTDIPMSQRSSRRTGIIM